MVCTGLCQEQPRRGSSFLGCFKSFPILRVRHGPNSESSTQAARSLQVKKAMKVKKAAVLWEDRHRRTELRAACRTLHQDGPSRVKRRKARVEEGCQAYFVAYSNSPVISRFRLKVWSGSRSVSSNDICGMFLYLRGGEEKKKDKE